MGNQNSDRFFALYYGFGTWVVCNPDGSLESSASNSPEMDLRADLLNFLFFGD